MMSFVLSNKTCNRVFVCVCVCVFWWCIYAISVLDMHQGVIRSPRTSKSDSAISNGKWSKLPRTRHTKKPWRKDGPQWTVYQEPWYRLALGRALFCPRGPSIKPEWFSESPDWTDGRTGTQEVEIVAPTNFQDKGVNNGQTDGWYSASVETTPSNHSPITMPGASGL